MTSSLPDPWPKVLPWLLTGVLLFSAAAVAGFGAAYLLTNAQAVPTVDPSKLPTPTPRLTPSATPGTSGPTATSAATASPSTVPSATVTPSAAASPTETAGPSPTPISYIVRRGDSLSKIAAQFGVTVEAIVELNGLDDPNHIEVGQVLLIPVP